VLGDLTLESLTPSVIGFAEWKLEVVTSVIRNVAFLHHLIEIYGSTKMGR
jgi:hypothetical protein